MRLGWEEGGRMETRKIERFDNESIKQVNVFIIKNHFIHHIHIS